MSTVAGTYSGHVTAINTEVRSASTVTSTADGATVLAVDDVADFAAEGGTLRVWAEGVTFADTLLRYSGIDDDADTITLLDAVAITAGGPAPAGMTVTCWDTADNRPVTEWIASVSDDSDPEGGIEAAVHHSLIKLLVASVRAGANESVTATRDEHGQWTVTEVHGKTPITDAPHGELYRATDMGPLATSTDTILVFDGPGPFRGGMGAASGIWTIPADGRYVMTLNVGWEADAAGQRRAWIEIDGDVAAQVRHNAASSLGTWQCVTRTKWLAAGTQVAFWASHSSPTSLHVLDGSAATITSLD
ncbi:hypothetical protein [Nocardioides montaniterrae]